jgi:superfamily II DNA or RNA helicase
MTARQMIADRYKFQDELLDQLDTPETLKPGTKNLIVSPTGTGKSFMIRKTQNWLGDNNTIVLLPTPELMPDFIEKHGLKVPDSKPKMVELANSLNIYSTIDLRNKIGRGKNLDHITDIIPDEAHHDDADTYEQIYMSMPDTIRRWGFTATPYCGNPKRTHKFRVKWDNIIYATTLDKCLASGAITYPNIVVKPLVNDDVMELKGGEFVISQVESMFDNKIEHALAITRDEMGWWGDDGHAILRPHKTTLIGVPSSKCFEYIKDYACKMGLQLEFIDQSTNYSQRKRIYAGFKACKFALVHINVVSEGKDLPVRNYLDMAPCMSPRLFFQRFGRCTRPLGLRADGTPEDMDALGDYLCTNRNIERHCYLFDNTLPFDQVKKAVAAFPEKTKRAGVRAFGIESLGRIKPTYVQLLNGLPITIYNVTQVEGGKKKTYMCLLHPSKAEPIWFMQTAGTVKDGMVQRMAYDRWEYIQPPTELTGYRSSPPYVLTEKQLNNWKRHAEGKGLDPNQKIDNKKYAILPVLIHSGVGF